MNRFQLFLETSNPDLFRKATSELGTLFYHKTNGDGVKDPQSYEIVYFSGSRIAKFNGPLSPELKNLCVASGFEVENLLLDETLGTVKVTEKNGDSHQ